MELSNFSRIGKGVISKMIGLQENYAEEYYVEQGKKRDEVKSGCYGCPVYQAKCQLQDAGLADEANKIECMCGSCADTVYTTEYKTYKKYINEKNMYGYQETLKSSAIKLLLAYHFLQPDAYGMIRDVSVKELAKLVGCTVTTVKSSNRKLMEYGYIQVCESGFYDGCVTVLLAEYKDYCKTASEGGRGYITMSSSMMGKILGMSGLNTLRVNLKGILLVDNASFKDMENPEMSSATATYKSLKGFFPGYCKKNVIIKAMQQDGSIFNFNCYDKCVEFKINKEFAQKNMRSVMTSEEEAKMKDFVGKLNQTLFTAGKNYVKGVNQAVDEYLSSYHIAEAKGYTLLPMCEKDYKDLAALCVQYNRAVVEKAVITAYNKFALRLIPIKNFGGLIRSLIRMRLNTCRDAA